MKIVCAPNSFKETLTAADAADAMAAGCRDADPAAQIDRCPVGDGGEGTMDALITGLGGRSSPVSVAGPLGKTVTARIGVAGDGHTGIVELAQASGLALVPIHRRDPTRTTTFGTGQLIRAAVAAGCETIIVCIGGSATCDGGAGLAQAIGVRFFDDQGRLITSPMTGGSLRDIARLEKPADLPTLRVACDVTNPLLGENGAAVVYGPQKGATSQQVRDLDAALAHFASVVGIEPQFPGAGAAGGAGYGLAALCGATLEHGIDLVLEIVRFSRRCRDADLVLTGEGRLDEQSLSGKAVIGVARAALQCNVPTFAIVGSTGPGAQRCLIDHDPNGALRRYISLTDRYGAERSMHAPAALLRDATTEVVRSMRR